MRLWGQDARRLLRCQAIQLSLWNHLITICVTNWNHFGTLLGPFGDHFGTILGHSGNNFGTMLVLFLDNVGMIPGPKQCLLVDPGWQQEILAYKLRQRERLEDQTCWTTLQIKAKTKRKRTLGARLILLYILKRRSFTTFDHDFECQFLAPKNTNYFGVGVSPEVPATHHGWGGN